MKTGPQSNYFDYDTGVWNDTESIPQDFKTEKPHFMAVKRSLLGETFEEQLIRLGKIQKPKNIKETHATVL
jgi:hypothetical protein